MWWVVAIAFLIGWTPHFLLHKWLDPVAPWYLGLFALGMVGALINFSALPYWQRLHANVAWGKLAIGTSVLLLIAFLLKPARIPSYPLYLSEPLVGITAVCWLIYCTRQVLSEEDGPRSLALRVFQAPWLVRIGLFSYSVYLLHLPVLVVFLTLLKQSPWSPEIRLAVLWLLVLPGILLICYGFYWVFERPFVNRRSNKHIR